MKNSKLKTYLIIIILGIFTIALFLLRKNATVLTIVNVVFWLIALFVTLFFVGLPRDKQYLKRVCVNYTVICTLSYLLIIYLLGLFVGFNKLIFAHSFKAIITNIFGPIILLISQTLVRFVFCKKNENNLKSIILFTAMLSINLIFLNSINYDFYDNERIFVFICEYTLPVIAVQALYTYLTYKVSFIPCFVIGFALDILMYFVPIYPALGDFLSSVFGIGYPFAIYMVISKIVKYHDKKKLSFKRFTIGVLTIPLLIFAGILIILISGIFRYKMIAIASNSMNPVYYRGDAVIYDQTDAKNVKVGEILVFQSDKKVVTHRVIKRYYANGQYYFVTKGDNNKDDDGVTDESKVYGKVSYTVKYLGFPTLWFSELFNK